MNNGKETESPREGEREEQEPDLMRETDFSCSRSRKASGSELG